jgi:hypothetical protein
MKRDDFSERKLVALADLILDRMNRPISGDHLATLLFIIDFEASAYLGHSITGATYLKGPWVPIIREMGTAWPRRFTRSRTPSWARVAGDVFAGILFLRMILRARP